MSATENPLRTARLKLVPYTQAEVLASVERMEPSERAQVSPHWLARVHQSPDTWTLGFAFMDRETGTLIGRGGFKGPPTADGVVEIAYGVEPAHQGKGYATEAAQAMTRYAFASGQVRTVIAHPLPEPNASTHVLQKAGFKRVGDVVDPEDGPVWRWEKQNDTR